MRRVAFEVTAGNDASLVATLTRQHGRTLTELRDGEEWKGEVRRSIIFLQQQVPLQSAPAALPSVK
jgi:hypothetical protein